MIRQTLPALLILLVASTTARSDWKFNPVDEISSEPGIRCLRVTAVDPAAGSEAKLALALCENNKVKVRVIDRPNGSESTLAEAMEHEQCLAGVNGGYFDPDYAPVGLLISDGRVVAPLRRARLLSGVLSVMNGRVKLQRTTEFPAKSRPSQAVQCGPFLVDHGTIVRGLDEARDARRSFVATGAGNRTAIGVCSAVSLAQLSRILAAGRITGDFKIDRALNLDGGSSTAFWCKRPEGTAFSIPEQKTVRDFVGISR